MATTNAPEIVPAKASFTAGFTAYGTDSLIAAYFALQAAAGVMFWVLLSFHPIHRMFDLMPVQHEVTDAFMQADLLVAIGGSALTAWAVRAKSRTAPGWAAFTTGGIVYPTIYLAVWVAHMQTGVADLAVMIPTAIICTWCTLMLWRTTPH